MEKDHAAFIKEYTTMVQQFQTERTAQWDEWFAAKQEQLAGDVAGKLQLQIDGLRTKVHNMAHKVNVAYFIGNNPGGGHGNTHEHYNGNGADGGNYRKRNRILHHGSRGLYPGNRYGKRYGNAKAAFHRLYGTLCTQPRFPCVRAPIWPISAITWELIY